jgi:hypothetical protein
MPYQYVNDHRLVTAHQGLWTIMQIIPRTNRLPSVRQLLLSNQIFDFFSFISTTE